MNEWHAFLTQQGARWQDENLVAFSGQQDAPRYLIPLVEHQLLRAEGADAGKFLQGQCTCDVREVEQHKLLMGAHCNRQGRMLSSFAMSVLPGQAIGLRLRRSVAQPTLAAMQRYIVFSKATLETANYVGLAVLGAQAGDLPFTDVPSPGHVTVSETSVLLHHSSGLLELWLAPEQAQALWHSLTPLCQPAPPTLVDRHFIQNGIAEVQAPTQESYIPQHFNYQYINAISFKKGCYTGQEIVARMQYRSQLKKHCYRLTSSDAHLALELGAALFCPDNQEKKVAEVVASAPGEILAVSTEDVAAATDGLIEPKSQTKFAWAELPYAIP